MKKIYIVLAHTGTLLSRIIKIRTGAEYTHSSIALDENLEQMYSFGRKYSYIAFIGGFVKEGASFGTYKRFYKTEISVFEILVTDEQYNKISEKIEYIKEHKKEYRFNILGLLGAGFNKKLQFNKTYYCAEFVKKLLEFAEIDTSELPEIIKPEHFKNLSSANLIYKGKLKKYRADNKFMEALIETMLRREQNV